MRKSDAIFSLWYDKIEVLSYRIGDSGGGFSYHDMKDFQVLETLVYMSAGSKIFTGPAKELLALFEVCNPNHQHVDDKDRKAYRFMLRRMNKLASAINHPPVSPPETEADDEDDDY